MSKFFRLLTETDKAQALLAVCNQLRSGQSDVRSFEVDPASFDAVPGKPFAYWVSEAVRHVFRQFPSFEGVERTCKQGLATADDFRFVRTWWESSGKHWFGFAKGGAFSPIYADIYLMVNWAFDDGEIENNLNEKGAVRSNVWMLRDTAKNCFLRPGITWPRRTQGGLSLRAMPAGCVFADKGPAAFVCNDEPDEILALLALANSQAFSLLVSLQMAFGSYEVGVIQRSPVPSLTPTQRLQLAKLARRAWFLKRKLDSITETSHAFLLPAALRARIGNYDLSAIEIELRLITAEIDAIAFDLYGFSDTDRQAAVGTIENGELADGDDADDVDDEVIPSIDALLAWAVGVAFGRFDWRLANGEREVPHDPEPFDALPKKSPGMLPDGAKSFHNHSGILVDAPGHTHDLARLIETVLDRVDTPVPHDVRRWLQKDFFAFHLQRYSKSRRKAPLYWPLSTASGSYTLWVYQPSLNNQTLFTAVNDFLDGANGKLTQVSREGADLRLKGIGRTLDEETQYETLQSFEQELADLRDTLLRIAPTYQPNHDDGVQITAAPLWSLFRHKPLQKLLKDTWAKLENGEYDWAHLAMAYWPDRVREKCKTDKSLAIAHGLEELYVAPEAVPKKTRGKMKTGVNK